MGVTLAKQALRPQTQVCRAIESEEPAYDHIKDLFRDFSHLLENLRTQMYGEYEPAKRSMIEYLDDFDNEPPKLRLVLRAHAAPS